MSNFFISDLHFGHKNCLAFDERPFLTVEEQDEYIIKHWNEVVGINDDVYILGDISWYNATKTIEIFNRLNGIKHLCIGNHDEKLLRNQDIRNLFAEIVYYKELYLNTNCAIVLSHYPIPCYKNHYYGWYHFYGHVHIGFEWNMIQHFQDEMRALYGHQSRMLNVGVMVPYMDYTPKTFEELAEIITKQEQKIVTLNKKKEMETNERR